MGRFLFLTTKGTTLAPGASAGEFTKENAREVGVDFP
jgi:hypothetical protein